VSYAQLPLSFEANQGQTDMRVKFFSHGRGYGLFLTGDTAVLELKESGASTKRSRPMSALQPPTDNGRRATNSVLRLKLVNANQNATVTGANELPGKVNYFLGNDPRKWRTNVPTYAEVTYRDVYPGIDLVYYGNQSGQLEYDFVVAPGADPSSILLAVDGVGGVTSKQKPVGSGQSKIDSNGDLVVHVDGDDEIRFHKPLVYQPDAGSSLVTGHSSLVQGHYVLTASKQVRFVVGPYDHTQPLVIDPVLVYSTYLGGANQDRGTAIAVDSSGNAYLTGVSSSTNFPTAHPLQGSFTGNQYAFVAKLNPTGSALAYSTYLGGGAEIESSVAVDSSGNAYVTGQTLSANFPTTPGVFQTSLGGTGAINAFVAKLNSTGSALVYSTYLGGSSGDGAYCIAVDSSGDAYVTGQTQSTNFPTASPYQASLAGTVNAFVAELNPTGSALVYSTYLGGSGEDSGRGIAVDSSGNAYVAGSTTSINFPTADPLQASLAGPVNAFVAKLNATGSALVYSTYLGGSGGDGATSIAVDSSGNAYVTGCTSSSDFPTANPLQKSLGGTAGNAFVAELNSTGSALVYSTYLGGIGGDIGLAIAVDSAGNAYLAGSTTSTDFPTANPLQAGLAGSQNAFVAKLSPAGSGLAYSTYLGGSNEDWGRGIAVDSSGNAYVSGGAISTDFPIVNPFQVSSGGNGDAFIAKIGTANSPGIAFGPDALTFSAQPEGKPSASQAVTLTAAGSQPLILTGSSISGDFAFATTATSCPYSGGTVPAGTTCTIDITFTPTAPGTRHGSVTINYNASGSSQSLSLTGTGVGASAAPVAAVSPSSLTFSGQLLGTTSAAQSVTLSNTGTAALTLANISTTGDFSQSNNCGVNVAASGSCTINVTFTPQLATPVPSAPTTLIGTLTITDNSGNTTGSTQTVSLSGTWEDFTITIPSGYSSSATVSPGQTAKFTLSVGGEGGFSQSVALTCAGVPTDSTCVVSPNSVAPGGKFTVLVTTTAPSAIAPRTLPQPRLPGPPALLLLAVLLACVAWTLRASRQVRASRRTVFLPLAVGLLLALALAGCGAGSTGGNSNHGTPPGTYPLTVTGTVGSGSTVLSHSVTLTLTVS
jgi:hypothetical protein